MMSAGPSSLMVTALLVLHHVTAFTCSAQRHCSSRLRRNATGGGSGEGLTWTGAQYRFECDTVDALLRDNGRYVPRNNIALRAQICGNDLYLAYPRWVPVEHLQMSNQTEWILILYNMILYHKTKKIQLLTIFRFCELIN